MKNMISTYTKDFFSMKKMTQIRQIFLKRIFFKSPDFCDKFQGSQEYKSAAINNMTLVYMY
jgi:hypothetical protein